MAALVLCCAEADEITHQCTFHECCLTSLPSPAYDVCLVPDFCSNGGVCQSMEPGQFNCTCPMGYTGKTCGDLVDNCVGQPCENGGTCINALNSFTCTCTAGYSGDTCSTDVDLCASSPCQNGGTCVDYGDGYYCECPDSVYLDSPPPDCAGWCTVQGWAA